MVNSAFFARILLVASLLAGLFSPALLAQEGPGENDRKVDMATETGANVEEADVGSGGPSIFARAWQGGVIVFLVLFSLVIASVLSWAIVFVKYLHLNRVQKMSDDFVKSFWESRSLNDLNGRLGDFPYSPIKEVFKAGYAELVRGSHLKEHTSITQLAVSAAVENLGRSLEKAKRFERKRLETYLPVLATIASASPFIGLFGTVWGIMGAFEGIARSGNASLAAVAPGISEALIATAFGLAAAIPAVMGYNMANAKIRGVAMHIDGFAMDFLNIVERYLVSDRNKAHASNPGAPQL